MKPNFPWRSLIVITAFFIIAGIFFGFSPPQREKAGARVMLDGHEMRIEIADTPAKQARGLSGHAPLADDEGMFFLFPEAETRTFWMKDMLFPIDIVWIRGNRIVGWVSDARPEPGKPPHELTLYRSLEPADKVLEMNAGRAQALGFAIGDKVMIK